MITRLGGNWFQSLIYKLYDAFFDPQTPLYLPKVIVNGYRNPELGIDIEPRDQVPLPDIPLLATQHPMPGGCGLGFTAGNASLATSANILTNLQSVVRPEGQTIGFEQEDSVLHVPLTFTALTVNGKLGISQPCKNAATAHYDGEYAIICANVALVISLTLLLEDKLSSRVDKITATVPKLTFSGKINNAPRNLGLWWGQLASDPQAIGPFRQMISDELTSAHTRSWIEQVVNPQLAKLPI